MTDEAKSYGQSAPSEGERFTYDRVILKAFARLSGGFWSGEHKSRAWFWTSALMLALVLNVLVQLMMNMWNGWFFNALERKDVPTLTHATLTFLGLIVLISAIGVLVLITRETLQVRWREWLTRKLVHLWLEKQRFYHLSLDEHSPTNPEYRIADDVRLALEPIVDFAIGLFAALLSALTFVGILLSIGGAFRFENGFSIPAYLVFAALLHGVIASYLMIKVGRSLPQKVGIRNAAEANLRFSLMRVRHEAHEISTQKTENHTHTHLNEITSSVVVRWLDVVRKNGHLTWITNGNAAINPILPLLLTTPKYISGDMTLGDVTQVTAAYIHVQAAITWFVDNYRRIAECYASCCRVVCLMSAFEGSALSPKPVFGEAALSPQNLLAPSPSQPLGV
jgi:vitamin B12/bleomycin/antimicrobial peptide transport system ATP-binding/permease protein